MSHKFIDWLVGLPADFELEYLKDIYEYEEAKKMPYISTAERIGIEKGIEKTTIEIAQRLLAENTPLVLIAKVTGLSVQKIKELQKEELYA